MVPHVLALCGEKKTVKKQPRTDAANDCSERECGCPFGEVVRQDQDVPVPRWGLFQRPKNVHANTLQRVSRSHGLHWRTVVLGRALPPRALRARAAPCVYVTTHPGPVESAPDSCQRPALTQVTCVPTVVH
ncbi:hypothetical protein T03_11975 [Trichinella britovi]|uniref:Uncharacterized protein n=1 Tax=Trichinella britovi TaxID=45882 RepID=A0A0V1CVX1_TRIBR|nr:hypothetical protein T03_11975 [Trichinella britovi]